MAYRRPEESAEAARRWRIFTNEHRQLFAEAALPGRLMDDHGLFDYFLMHGDVGDGSAFSTAELAPAEWAALDELVEAYVSQFYDPGVSLGPRPE